VLVGIMLVGIAPVGIAPVGIGTASLSTLQVVFGGIYARCVDCIL